MPPFRMTFLCLAVRQLEAAGASPPLPCLQYDQKYF